MAAKRDYYEVLGINRDADAGTIKKAYRKLAKKYHPDTNPGDQHAEKLFKEVTEAYTILSDPEKKKLYDQFGHAAFDGSGAGQNPYEILSEIPGEDIRNIILKAETWMTSLGICLTIFSRENNPMVLKAEDFIVRDLTAVSLQEKAGI